eukprot:TRINITY_DN37472_c0_g1_i1.p1 TRINITY_DN37472_c0_g1~~TRINITY_DN37472_c0_g1_i1.p1  ORF type:complete len:398 (+),score=112.44 TRINITY_DN37472_c0_g1_i1:42-1235(+)
MRRTVQAVACVHTTARGGFEGFAWTTRRHISAVPQPKLGGSVGAADEYTVSEPIDDFKALQTEDLVEYTILEGRSLKPKTFLRAKKLIFTHKERGTTVDVFPLYMVNVSQWYVHRIWKSIVDSEHYSTVYLGSPLVTVKTCPDPPKKVGYSQKVALELSFSCDFPREIPVADPDHAPTFVQVHTPQEFLEYATGRSTGGLGKLLAALSSTRMHESDSVAIVTSQKGLHLALETLRAEDGWELRTEDIAVIEILYRKYGIFLNGFARLVWGAFMVFLMYNITFPYNFYCALQEKNKRDASAREVAVENITYVNTGYKPEQEILLHKLKKAMLDKPPGTGVDDRVHNSFFHRPLSSVAYPKALLPRDRPIILKDTGEVINPHLAHTPGADSNGSASPSS